MEWEQGPGPARRAVQAEVEGLGPHWWLRAKGWAVAWRPLLAGMGLGSGRTRWPPDFWAEPQLSGQDAEETGPPWDVVGWGACQGPSE